VDEKREFSRVYKQAQIGFSLLPSQKIQRNITADLSTSGVRFISDIFLPLRSNVKLEIRLPSALRPIDAVAEVVRVKTVLEDERYEVAVKFSQIDKEDSDFIRDYLYGG
jgi:hypothetical protein